MKLRCDKDYTYGSTARMAPKLAKDAGLDPKDYTGGPIREFKAGETYELPDDLARRLLKDYGPRKGRVDVRFQPTNMQDLMDVIMGEGEKVALKDVLDRGFVQSTDEEVPAEQQKEVEVAA
jgi:hypothetical protein